MKKILNKVYLNFDYFQIYKYRWKCWEWEESVLLLC